MLGVCLLFVGIVLINNGMCTLYKVDGKSTAVMNILTGGLSLFINFVNLVMGNYYAAGTGLLFCFTYLFVAFSKILKLSPIPFVWFSTFVKEIKFREKAALVSQDQICLSSTKSTSHHMSEQVWKSWNVIQRKCVVTVHSSLPTSAGMKMWIK